MQVFFPHSRRRIVLTKIFNQTPLSESIARKRQGALVCQDAIEVFKDSQGTPATEPTAKLAVYFGFLANLKNP